MKAIIFTLLTIPVALEAQNATEWQSQHSDGILITRTTYGGFSAKERALLGNEVLILDTDWEDIERLATDIPAVDQPVSAEEEAVKTWVSNHQEVPIVSYADFLAASEPERQGMIDQHALIYRGEKLVLEDIEHYRY